jgi:hypothetical protein
MDGGGLDTVPRQSLLMDTEIVPETSVIFNQLTQLIGKPFLEYATLRMKSPYVPRDIWYGDFGSNFMTKI